jgi:hypothetical protein
MMGLVFVVVVGGVLEDAVVDFVIGYESSNDVGDTSHIVDKRHGEGLRWW